MANTQETLIYIEKENHTEAEFMSRTFVNKELKNRAYLNALGAELVTKYLTSEGIKFNNVHNLHSISKVLESVDIADILLPNIHLDVRVVFNEKHIFIPKSHFELELVPDAYVVLKLDEEFKHVELLGYFKPSQINKRNENREYYFFDRSKLSSPASLTKFVKDFTGRTSRDISEEDLLRGRELAISLADHNISVSEEKELLELLLLSDVLRESVLEFDNFETLSYSTAPVLSESLAVVEIAEENEETEEEEIIEEETEEIVEEAELEPAEEISLATMAMDEEIDLDAAFPEAELEEETLEEAEEEPLEDPVSDEDAEDETTEEIEEEEETSEKEVAEEVIENTLDEELIEEHIEEVTELDFVDLDAEVEDEVLENDLTEKLETPKTEELAEEELSIEEEEEEEELTVSEEETIEETDEDDEFVNELNEAAGLTEEIDLEEETLEEDLDFVEPSEEPIIDEEEIETEDIENVSEEIIEEVEEETLEPEGVEEVESTELDIAENITEDTIEPLVEEPLAEETLALDETFDVSEAVEEEIIDTVEEITPDPTIVDENLPTLDLDETPALEVDPNDLGDDLLGGNLVDENNEIITTTEVTETVDETVVEEEEALEIEEPPLTPDEPFVPQNMENLSVDSILDQTIASISTKKEEPVEKKEEKPVQESQEKEIEPLDVAAAATATALAGAVAKAAEEEAQATASEDAMKLAAVSGEMIDDIVQNLEDDQQKSLDKIDYEKTDITAEIDAPEHMIAATEDLSLAKMEASLEAELSGEFGGPTDLENLDEVEVYEEKEFIQDSVDFGSMATVSKEELFTQGNENLDLGNLSDINIDMSAGANNLPDLNFSPNEEGVVDLPQFSSGGITISEDGTSPMDAMLDMSLGMENKEEELMDLEGAGDSPLSEDQIDFSSCMKPSTRKREESSSYDEKPKHTIDEATKQALLANNIVRSDDDDDDSFASEDFGETIVLDDDEPFVIDAEETQVTDTETTSDETDISEFFGDELTEDEIASTEETTEEVLDELAFDDIETMNDESEAIESIENTEEIQAASEEVTEPIAEEQQDWMNDTDYTDLEDVEVQPQESVEDFITEPTAEEKTYAVKENSTVISDKSFQAGEIHIDINAQNAQMYEDDESLASIYNPNSRVPGGALLQTPGRMSNTTASQGNAARGLLGILGTLIILALVGGIGFGVAQFFKAPKEEAPQPITDGPLPTSNDNGVSEANTLKIDPNNVVKMDNNSNALATTKTSTQAKTQNTTASASSTQKKGPAKSFVSIEKITWSLPSYITHNAQFKQYFQSAGKSLKLSLTSDLLLATDYIYSNNMRVGITFGKDGSLQSSQIITSSGSNEIDKIVLQTVNQVLTTLKAPNSVGNEENTPVTLNIYF